MRVPAATASELAAGAVHDDPRQDEHHAGDHDQVGGVLPAGVVGAVMGDGGGQKPDGVY